MKQSREQGYDIDVVIIGVNASATLLRCIDSVRNCSCPHAKLHIFYVDGGSTDNSTELARSYGDVSVIAMEPCHPTPGLGRNAGWRAGTSPLVQFLDSDTVMDAHWIESGLRALEENPGCAAVFGNRTEMNPQATVFNWIADQEWNPRPGEVQAFGGDVLIRRQALEASGGYDEELVSGEDPECSRRVIANGGSILHLDVPMTLHDMAMRTVRQYWRRGFRTGYGYAAVVARHGGAGGFWLEECKRILIRGGLGLLLLLLGLGGLFCAWWSVFVAIPGVLLLLYPRIFRIRWFMEDKNLPEDLATRYAWHCSLIVLPEIFGMARYVLGVVFNRPLRNRSSRLRSMTTMGLLLLVALSGGCAHVSPEPSPEATIKPQTFRTENQEITKRFASPQAVESFSNAVPDDYLMGPGDALVLSVWKRPELDDDIITVAPDGDISVMRIGTVHVEGRTVEDVTREISERLGKYYENPEVRLSIKTYANNKAFVLGRVTNPGLINFTGRGTLLEALSLAGGLPLLREEAFLTKCAIIRGKSTILWVDLRELLQNGNMALNARIRNNDIIFIPESENELIYVMGNVVTPGIVRLKAKLSLMDAIMYAGGPTEDADMTEIYIIRDEGGTGVVRRVDLRKLLENADFSENFVLQDNDVVYVAAKGIANVNYVMRQLMPMMQLLDIGVNALEGFGAMPYARMQWWGCLNCESGSDSRTLK